MIQILIACTLPLIALAGPATPVHPARPAPAASTRKPEPTPHKPAADKTIRKGKPTLPAPKPKAPRKTGTNPTADKPQQNPPKGQTKKILAIVDLSKRLCRTDVSWTLRLYDTIRKALGGSWPKGLAPIDDPELRRVLAGDRPDWSLQQAQALLDRARLAYATLKIQQALTDLQAARELLLRQVPVASAKPLLAQVWAYLVMCHNSLGQGEQARKAAADLALVSADGKPLPRVLWKRYKPKPKQNKPTRRFVRRGRRLKTRGPGALVSVPKGATVYVDFKVLPPTAPQWIVLPNQSNRNRLALRADRHKYLAVEAPGKRRFFTIVSPTNLDPLQVVLPPAGPDPEAKIRAWLDDIRAKGPDAERISALGARVHAHWILVLLRRPDGRHLALYETARPASPRWTGLVADLETQPSTKQVESLVSLLAPKPKARPTPRALARSARKAARKVAARPTNPATKPKKKPLWKKWYFWVALGAVAVAATVFAVTKDKQSDEVDIRVYRP